MKEYAVYTDSECLFEGTYDNDFMDWFTDYQAAKAFAIEKSQEVDEDVYLSEVEDGDFSDGIMTFSKGTWTGSFNA